jgi:acyl-CoA synthetase (NDP forming)
LPLPGGLEVILGAQHDSQFGAQILLGLGGIYAEIINKTATRFVPLSPDNIQEMFEETQLDRFLAGKRNQESLDKDALTDALLRIAAFMEEHGRSVQELDINPLIVLPRGKGLYAVDALIITAGKI